jgi:hypothetical protein
MGLREGDVVLVTGKVDERVRPHDGSPVYGTIVSIHGTEVSVLLASYDFWQGSTHQVRKPPIQAE